jgi:hypothetical protein
MIKPYINKLIENLPDTIKNAKTPLQLDLVLDGGLFNGSYLVGALYFIKEMEHCGYVKVNRISGSSIGSIIGLLYFIDALDEASSLYEMLLTDFKKTHNLTFIKTLKERLHHKIPRNVCEILNNKFYIAFTSVEKRKKFVKRTYKNVDEIIDCIIKSCFIPFLIDGNIVYKGRYIDGLNPYFFKTNSTHPSRKRHTETKVLFMNLNSLDKILGSINVKNERTNLHRILSGMLDIHSFFIKGSSTSMCSYVNNWSISDQIYMYFRYLVEKIIITILFSLHFVIKNNLIQRIQCNLSYDVLTAYGKQMLVLFLDSYCI